MVQFPSRPSRVRRPGALGKASRSSSSGVANFRGLMLDQAGLYALASRGSRLTATVFLTSILKLSHTMLIIVVHRLAVTTPRAEEDAIEPDAGLIVGDLLQVGSEAGPTDTRGFLRTPATKCATISPFAWADRVAQRPSPLIGPSFVLRILTGLIPVLDARSFTRAGSGERPGGSTMIASAGIDGGNLSSRRTPIEEANDPALVKCMNAITRGNRHHTTFSARRSLACRV
jgi:hypothetical protein